MVAKPLRPQVSQVPQAPLLGGVSDRLLEVERGVQRQKPGEVRGAGVNPLVDRMIGIGLGAGGSINGADVLAPDI